MEAPEVKSPEMPAFMKKRKVSYCCSHIQLARKPATAGTGSGKAGRIAACARLTSSYKLVVGNVRAIA